MLTHCYGFKTFKSVYNYVHSNTLPVLIFFTLYGCDAKRLHLFYKSCKIRMKCFDKFDDDLHVLEQVGLYHYLKVFLK